MTILHDQNGNTPYKFPLGIQMVLPDNYSRDSTFAKSMELLQELRFSCIELNIANPKLVSPSALKDYLHRYDLTMTMFASGFSAKTYELSLSSTDIDQRLRSVDYCRHFIEFCAEMETGIILGLIQGAPVADVSTARDLFCRSLDDLVPIAQKKRVSILIEATNKTLTCVANSADQTKKLVAGYPSSTVRILLDTYHMAFEESDTYQAIVSHAGDFDSIHYSDDNRFYPGLGQLDFQKITESLASIDFYGPIVLEANIRNSFETDVRASVQYLRPILARP